jgi:4-amino-4-deoxy-L-arabinose transferase-like glycosyltransferase
MKPDRAIGYAPPVSHRELLVVLVIALPAAGISLFVAYAVLEGIPHVSDEIAYLFQARIFLSGRLCLQPPSLPNLFQLQNIILDSTHWCAKYPPGWPLILVPGVFMGVPALVNPILLALSIIGIWQLGRRLYDVRTGILAAGALGASPFALLMGAGFMAHVPTLCASIWCLVALVTAAAGPRQRLTLSLLLAGVFFGIAFAIRPFSAVALVWPAVLWCLLRQRGLGSSWWLVLGWMTFGALPGILFVFTYNGLVFGSPTQTGYQVYNPSEVTLTLQLVQTPIAILGQQLPRYLLTLNRLLWGWPWPDLLVLTILFWPRTGWGKDGMLLACASSLILGHSFYYYFDIVYGGPRLVFEALGPIALLLARSLLRLFDILVGYARRLSDRWGSIVARWIAAATLSALVILSFYRHLLPELWRQGQWYHGQSTLPLRQAKTVGVGKTALIFVSGPSWVFGSFFLHNDLMPWEGGRVFVRDIPEFRAEAIRLAPRNEIWGVLIVLEALPGPNTYPEIFYARDVRWERVQ